MRPKTYLAAMVFTMVAGTAQAHVVKHRHHRHHTRHHHRIHLTPVPAVEFERANPTPGGIHISSGSIHQQVTNAAIRNGVPVPLAHGIVRAESMYRCHAHASDGLSQGIMQVRPATARSVGVYGSMSSCENSLEAGMRYLKQALARSGGNWGWAATLYNRGLGARQRFSSYASRVLRLSGS